LPCPDVRTIFQGKIVCGIEDPRFGLYFSSKNDAESGLAGLAGLAVLALMH
jgi:hypothetical protein